MSITRRLSRRRFLSVSGIAAGGLTLPRLVFAQNKKAVHFTLPWVAEGSNLFTFVAKGMGFWEKHGLDVDIARGSGSLAGDRRRPLRFRDVLSLSLNPADNPGAPGGGARLLRI